jgi:Putative zinc-finger
MTARCTGEAVSWLRLERYHLGEVGGDERRSIDQHLAGCPACASCLARIERDDAVPLPALPERLARAAGKPASGMDAARTARVRWLVRTSAVAGTLAAAAAVLLFLRAAPHPGSVEGPVASGNRVKGHAVAFSLVRDDGTRIDGDEGAFRDGDRFKAIVTCPPGDGLTFDLVVIDRGGTSFPLEPAVEFACGNERPMPGAFRLTGKDDERVCLVWGAPETMRRESLLREIGAPGAGTFSRACIALRAVTP